MADEAVEIICLRIMNAWQIDFATDALISIQANTFTGQVVYIKFVILFAILKLASHDQNSCSTSIEGYSIMNRFPQPEIKGLPVIKLLCIPLNAVEVSNLLHVSAKHKDHLVKGYAACAISCTIHWLNWPP